VLLGPVSKKAEKTDVKHSDYLHVDADPENDETPDQFKARLQPKIAELERKPTAVVDSGNGLQLLWRLAEPCADQSKVEAANYALAELLGADPSTRNVDRIMRLPGTINHPNKVKRDRGRVPCAAKLIEFNGAVHKFEDMPRAAPEVDLADASTESGEDKLEDVIRNGRYDLFDGDRSDAVWFVVLEMLRRGYYDRAIVDVLTDRANKISEHIYDDQRDPEGYAERQVRQIKEKIDFAKHKGKVTNIPGNVCIAMIKLNVTVRYDRFGLQTEVDGIEGFDPFFTDDAMGRLWLTMARRFNFQPSDHLLRRVVVDVAHLNGFHPVCDYLNSLVWDGVVRIDKWLTTYGGAEDNEYTNAVGTLWLIAAVRRVRQPGCKFDEIMVWIGPQGMGKSEALKALCPNEGWFSDDLPLNVKTSKQFIERTRGRWIIECAELSGMKKAEIELVKATLSRTHDRDRLVWDRLTTNAPRQSVAAGTTNSNRFLKDQTGNRRFWPIGTPRWKVDELRRVRDQLWAEAAAREAKGESIRLPERLWAEAGRAQDERLLYDTIHDVLYEAIGGLAKGKIATTSVLAILNTSPAQVPDTSRIDQAMTNLGWVRTKSGVQFKDKYARGYTKGEKPWPEVTAWRGTGSTLYINIEATELRADHYDLSPLDFATPALTTRKKNGEGGEGGG
jgi:hypothetical protein